MLDQRGAHLLAGNYQKIRRLLTRSSSVARLIVKTGADRKFPRIRYLISLARQRAIPVQYVPPSWFRRRGLPPAENVACLLSPLPFLTAEDLIQKHRREEPTTPLIVVDRVTDQTNIGNIARSAVFWHCHHMIVHISSSLISEHALVGAAGAFSYLSLARYEKPTHLLNLLKENGYFVVATTHRYSEKTVRLPEFPWKEFPLALVMGNEERGVSPVFLEEADCWLKIEGPGEIPVLNVSNALAIILYDCWLKTNKSDN